jgi:hypothetical protein
MLVLQIKDECLWEIFLYCLYFASNVENVFYFTKKFMQIHEFFLQLCKTQPTLDFHEIVADLCKILLTISVNISAKKTTYFRHLCKNISAKTQNVGLFAKIEKDILVSTLHPKGSC